MKEEIMLTAQSRNLLGILSMNGSSAGIFQTLKRQTTTAGFVAYAGIISAVLGLWMWLWRDTTLQDNSHHGVTGPALTVG
jgi:protein-S-isoprenylcysteine O-methyltransferase Ste14